ncbi:hypothetical protein [Flavobacterium sp.]|uniref:hypothetical protein n=1 Tax=Flavobacterium sp. TaxID=239 RepID=UPI0039E55142
MSKLQIKALVYQLLCFAALFFLTRYIVDAFTNVSGVWIPVTAFVVGTLLSPKFQAVRTKDGEKMFMSWLFVKGIREVK